MPYTKEEKSEYNKQYNLKNKEKIKQQQKEYRKKNKEKKSEYLKHYRLENKEQLLQRQKEYDKKYRNKNKDKIKEYRQSESFKKSNRISKWKHQGILCFDYNLLYDIFLSTNKCEFCNCELDKCNKSRKCLDHDHNINDKFNVRGVLCNACNLKDVLK